MEMGLRNHNDHPELERWFKEMKKLLNLKEKFWSRIENFGGEVLKRWEDEQEVGLKMELNIEDSFYHLGAIMMVFERFNPLE
jgi:hypothetical protein